MKIKVLLFLILILLLAFCYKTFSIKALQDSRKVDGIVEPVYTQDCFPKTLHKNGVSKKYYGKQNVGLSTLPAVSVQQTLAVKQNTIVCCLLLLCS